MTIDYRNFAPPGSGGIKPVTLFTDSFNRGQLNPSGVVNWNQIILGIAPRVDNIRCGSYTCGSQVDASNGLNLSVFAAENFSTFNPSFLQCLALTQTKTWGKQQFAQCTWIGDTGAIACTAGLAVWVDFQGMPAASGACYALCFLNNGHVRLDKLTASSNALTETTLANNIAGGDLVQGNVYRLSVTPGSGQNTLVVTLNGTIINTTIDNVSPLTPSGMPGFGQVLINQSGGTAGFQQVRLGSFGTGL
jgi:hypothetical protein